jgi:hypothetical protein
LFELKKSASTESLSNASTEVEIPQQRQAKSTRSLATQTLFPRKAVGTIPTVTVF